MYVYVIVDYDSDEYNGTTLVGVHKTRESARKEVELYLRDTNLIESHAYGMFDEYFYEVSNEWDEVRKCFLLIKMMEVEEWA